jgi:hypothetical protein
MHINLKIWIYQHAMQFIIESQNKYLVESLMQVIDVKYKLII